MTVRIKRDNYFDNKFHFYNNDVDLKGDSSLLP